MAIIQPKKQAWEPHRRRAAFKSLRFFFLCAGENPIGEVFNLFTHKENRKLRLLTNDWDWLLFRTGILNTTLSLSKLLFPSAKPYPAGSFFLNNQSTFKSSTAVKQGMRNASSGRKEA